MQNVERLASIRSRIAQAEADPRPSLTDGDVERHFANRLAKSLAARDDRG